MSRWKLCLLVLVVTVAGGLLVLVCSSKRTSRSTSQQEISTAVAEYSVERRKGFRGHAFYSLTYLLDGLRGKLTEAQAVDFLGPPDLIQSWPATENLAYFCDSWDIPGKGGAVAVAEFKNGALVNFSYGDSARMGRFWRKPATMPSSNPLR